MTKDLEETLRELGPGYRAVVDRLAAGDALPLLAPQRRAPALFRPAMLTAASVAALLCAIVSFLGDGEPRPGAQAGALSTGAPNEYRLAETCGDEALSEMLRTQNADGSWKNDFLTRRNADALASRPEAAAQIASKKARRNLRARGLL